MGAFLRATLLAAVFCFSVQASPKCGTEVSRHAGRPKIYETSLSTNYEFLQSLKFGMFNLSRLQLTELFAFDQEFAAQIVMKGRLLAHRPQTVMVGTQAEKADKASAALLRLVADTLAAHPDERLRKLYQWDGKTLACPTAGRSWNLAKTNEHPLRILGQIIPDDILITTFGAPADQTILAGSVAFPSGWVLENNIDANVTGLHDYAKETAVHYAEQLPNIGRMIAQMQPNAPILRNNWFIYNDPTLSQPGDRVRKSYEVPEITEANIGTKLFLRAERETFMVFEADGEKYFAMFIRPMVYPLEDTVRFPELRARFLEGLESPRDQYRAGGYLEEVTRYVRSHSDNVTRPAATDGRPPQNRPDRGGSPWGNGASIPPAHF